VDVAAFGLLVLGVVLAEPVSRALAAARWPARDPVGALLVWQAVGLAGGLALVGAGVVYGLAPFGPDLLSALSGLLSVLATRPSALLGIGADHVLALAAGVALACWLLGVMAVTTARTLRARRRHRDLLDVLATPWPAVPGARVLDHPLPVAYCLPGRRSRLVFSVGVLRALDAAQVVAVLAHERAHLRERHDLVVLPFVAWGATAPFVRGMVCAQVAVAALVEMRADDVAAARTEPAELACALRTVGGAAPAAAVGSLSTALDRRIARITTPARPLPAPAWAFVRLAAAALVTLPPAALLLT
jgi:Zn-dependent protease with chaperone function